MNLTPTELGELPLRAAVVDSRGHIMLSTPEWRGAGPGTVAHRVRHSHLLVDTAPAPLDCLRILVRLLECLDDTSAALGPPQSLRVVMLAASLRLLVGRAVTTRGSSHDAVDLALAGIGARTALTVTVESGPPFEVAAPEVVALVLVQLAANAESHAGVSAITIGAGHSRFFVSWHGESSGGSVATARRRDDRQRWGLGFARIAADTLGGTVYAPHARADGTVVAEFELGIERLTLPLAGVIGGGVVKATRAWDDETGLPPGSQVSRHSRLWRCVEAASAAPGRMVVVDGWHGRRGRHLVWVAVPPDGVLERLRDVLDGLSHERALWDNVPEPNRTRIFALASLLASHVGAPMPQVPADTWRRRMQRLAPALGLTMPVPELVGLGALDPRVSAFLAAEVGERFEVAGDDLYLVVRAGCRGDALLRTLPASAAGSVKLS